MAITKIHAIKSTLGKALAYIENPDKTDGQMLVSGYNCEPQTASIDFEMTAVLAHKARNLKRKRSTNLAYHLIQSFSPEDKSSFIIEMSILLPSDDGYLQQIAKFVRESKAFSAMEKRKHL